MLISALSSCDSGVETENISAEDLYSVSSFISPQDTVFRVYLYHGKAIGTIDNPDFALVDNAEVIITDGILQSDTLQFNSEHYEGEIKNVEIEALKTYFLKIRLATGGTLEASCTVPPTPEIPQVTGERTNDDYLFQVSWNNPEGFQYFILAPFGEGFYESTTPAGTRKEQITARLLDDIRFPSDDQSSFNIYEGIVSRAYLAENPAVTIYLRNVEESLYKYFETYYDFEEWDNNNEGNLFPNFREPQPVFSNIEGGVGIFAGHNQSVVRHYIF